MSKLKDTLVLKVGTSTLVENERLDTDSFARIGRQIGELQMRGYGVMVVTSAARKCLPGLGWQTVVGAWRTAIDGNVQDFLLTDEELDTEGGCGHIIAAMQAGRIAITNTHDVKLQPGSQYVSNDLVGARLAVHASEANLALATRYVMLSDVHGVYEDMGNADSVISVISDMDNHRHLAGGAGTVGATGGMATKFTAARMTTAVGIETYIAHGRVEDGAIRTLAGEIGTKFTTQQETL